MDARGGEPITTNELLERLGRRGLRVTRTMLAQDVRAGYLPAPEMDPRGPRGGIGRQRASWSVQRATYLYRLRRRGAQGHLLRVLLFLRDGRGWEAVKPICLAGLTKLARMQGRRVTGRLRRVTPTNLDVLTEEFAAGEFASPAVARFVWGMGFFGRPLPGGSLQPLIEAFRTTYGLGSASALDRSAEGLVANLGLSWAGMLVAVEAADPAQADAARQQLLAGLRWFRRLQQAYQAAHGVRGRSTNPLTLFGCPPEQLHALCRSLPGRPTPAQLLAALLGPFVVLEGMCRTGDLPEMEEEATGPP